MDLRGLTAVLAASASLVSGASASAAVRVPACTGKNLTASFRVVRGSAGAGNIVSALRLRNRSRSTCFVTGIPGSRSSTPGAGGSRRT